MHVVTRMCPHKDFDAEPTLESDVEGEVPGGGVSLLKC